MPATGFRFLILNLGHFYTHLFMLLHPTVVLALEKEFAGSYGTLLLPSTAAFAAFGAGTLPAGWLGDRMRRETLLAIFFIGLGAGAGLAAAATGTVMLTAGLALLGLAASIYHPVGIAMVVEGRASVGRALGINGVWGNMGVAAAPLVAGGLAAAIGWRAAFAVPAAVAVATGLVYLAVLMREPRAARAAPREDRQRAPEPLSGTALWRLVAALAIAAFCGGLIFHGTTVVLPKLFEERLGGVVGGLAGVGGLASLVLALAAFTQIGVGTLIDRKPIRPVFIAVALAQIPLLLAVGLAGGLAVAVASLAMMAAVFGELPIHDALVARHAAPAWRARLYSVTYVLSLGVSALAVPLVAELYERGGFPVMFAVFAAFAALVVIAALILPRPAPARLTAEHRRGAA
ncbi:MFS transporter [Kaustia mangrovi]|uniref:MFS transporter n=1 Tax=Kaustia mangrovi TaxID=2593653 RepID=A0A7S8C6Q5_9HYPH|nr:MFS transporter [Kaustia mangrovi]QPC44396.1 MFS transporter [Kaustia mangrovi]